METKAGVSNSPAEHVGYVGDSTILGNAGSQNRKC